MSITFDQSTEIGTEVECPRPDKNARTQEDAIEYAKWARKNLHPDIAAYKCECGAWHVGKSKAMFNKRLRTVMSKGRHRQRLDRQRTDVRRKR